MADNAKLKRFAKFRSLIAELRLQIWGHAIADVEPRIVKLKIECATAVLPTAAPGLFHASHEARQEMAKTYTSLHVAESYNDTVINFEKDTLLMRVEPQTYLFARGISSAPWTQLCRKLAVDTFLYAVGLLKDDLIMFLARFSGVEELIYVMPITDPRERFAEDESKRKNVHFEDVCRLKDHRPAINGMSIIILRRPYIKTGRIVAELTVVQREQETVTFLN